MDRKTLLAIFTITFLSVVGLASAGYHGDLVRVNGQNYWNSSGITSEEINSVLYVDKNNGSDIQAKIDSCPSDGCTIYIPSGDYDIGSTGLSINKTGIILGGSGRSTLISYSGSGTAIHNPSGSYVENIQVNNLHLKQTNTYTGTGISTKHMLYATVNNVMIEGFSTGLTFPVFYSFYNTAYNPYIYNTRYGINMSANQNNVIGGRIYPENSEDSIGIYINGKGNYVSGISMERLNGYENSTGILIVNEANVIESVWFEALKTGLNISGNYNFVSGAKFGNCEVSLNDEGIGNTIVGSNSPLKVNADELGVNVDSIEEKLHVKGGNLEGIRIESTSSAALLDFYSATNHNYRIVDGYSTDGLQIYGGTDTDSVPDDILFATFKSDGKIGFGTDSPSDRYEFQDGRVTVDQNLDDIGLFVDHEGSTSKGFYLDTITTTDDGMLINSNANRTNALRGLLRITDTNSATTSPTVKIQSDGTGKGFLLEKNGNGVGLNIQQDGVGQGVFIDQNGNDIGLYVDHEGSSSKGIYLDTASTTDDGMLINSNVERTNGLRALLRVTDTNSATTASTVKIQSDGSSDGLVIEKNNNGTSLKIDSDALLANRPAINILDIPNNESMILATNDKICWDDCSTAWITYNGTCIVSSNGGCI